MHNHLAGGKVSDALGKQLNLHYGLSLADREFFLAFPYAAGSQPKENPKDPKDRYEPGRHLLGNSTNLEEGSYGKMYTKSVLFHRVITCISVSDKVIVVQW
jgi:hypothetical protein